MTPQSSSSSSSSLLFVAATPFRPLPTLSCSARRPPSACQRDPARASQGWHTRQSSALNQDTSADRYIDLHTMQVIRAANAHLCDAPHPNTSFGLFDEHTTLSEAAQSAHVRELLFTADTLPLTEQQKDVVQALLSRRSALFVAPSSREKYPLLIDVVMRSRLWKKTIVYCASSPRAAEAAYTVLCAQLPPDRRQEIQLGLDSLPHDIDACADAFRVIITSPELVRSALANCDENDLLQNAAIFFVDTFTRSNATQWEEILLAMPSRILLCVFTAGLPYADHQLLPLWLETIQNSVVSVTPSREASFTHRIENPQNSPLLRTFAYNAATHDSPVQVSLTLLKEMFDNRSQQSFVPKYSECFLHGIKMIPTETPSMLLFRTAEEARFADIAALAVADAKTVLKNSRRRRGRPGKGKERTASSRAAAKKRREAAYETSLLFPAIAIVAGQRATENAACAVQSALGDELTLLWDDESREHVMDIVEAFKAANEGRLTESDIDVLSVLLAGIGIIHSSVSPAVRLIIEECFRAGFIPLLCVDSFLGSTGISALPSAKSVLIDASAIGVCDDVTKGLVSAATVVALAGRAQKDDVGNLIFLWYDESVDDESAGYEITSTLLHHIFSGDEHDLEGFSTSSRLTRMVVGGVGEEYGEMAQCGLSSSYGGVLRSVRRFGTDAYESIFEYTLNSYKGWLERAAIRATLERLDVEKTAISSRLASGDWRSIAEYERREAKVSESKRVLKAMERRYEMVLSRRVLNELRESAPGRLIGVAVAADSESEVPYEQRLFRNGADDVERVGNEDAGRDGSENGKGSALVAKGKQLWKKERVASAVFVTVLDQEAEGKRIGGMQSELVVVCIMADALWTIVPLADVVAVAAEGESLVSNVDLLMMPHPATFDLEAQSQRATCRPIDKGECEAVERVADELIARVASDERPELKTFGTGELEAQRKRVALAEELHRQSVWYGREEEIMELRKLRRREAKLGDEIEWVQKRENELEEELFNGHNEHRSNQQAVMAVLEDCHAVTVQGECNMHMTPIGTMGSQLACDFPLFAGACLCLIDEVGTISAAQLAALVALLVCEEVGWDAEWTLGREEGSEYGDGDDDDDEDDEDEQLDLSILRGEGDLGTVAGNNGVMHEERHEVHGLPHGVTATVHDICAALRQLHARHALHGGGHDAGVRRVSAAVPRAMDVRAAEALSALVLGASWRDAVEALRGDDARAYAAVRQVCGALEVVMRTEALEEGARVAAKEALRALREAVPLAALGAECVLREGVVERVVATGGYERWWRSARDSIAAASSDAKSDASVEEAETTAAAATAASRELMEPS
eukprot:TRINITY_DN1447_c0_g1_i1.p1 TRINITY_DN1447_c0_g1~~TRINITY_DN1447_c0_g1_i1.p1  ORF type:complete len:1337 (+),score=286.67 TRINITY_DN1447_c0_g1_i1:23-4012(+)